MNLKGVTLFSSAGVGEYYLRSAGIDIICANELLSSRANLYSAIYPNSHMICGDINDAKVFGEIIKNSQNVDFMLASPPCQGMSIANKYKGGADPRNLLILKVVQAISLLKPTFVMIENVPALLKIKIPYRNQDLSVIEVLEHNFGNTYNIEAQIMDAADYGVPQTRLRAIIKLWKKSHTWPWPVKAEKKITLREAIGSLPSLEAGEKSKIKWHFARPHTKLQIEAMKYTPTGHSAFENTLHFPKKADGTKVRGFDTTYRRMEWDKPCATITIRNDAISSQRNVHPGRRLKDGTYSDARVLTPLELMLCDSLPSNWAIPDNTSEILIRQVIGESIPPLLVKTIVEKIDK